MMPDNHIQHCMLLCFHLQKKPLQMKRLICQAYGDDAVSIDTCQEWFERFKNGNFNLSEKFELRRPIRDTDIMTMLAEDPSQTIRELSDHFVEDYLTVFRRIRKLNIIYKDGKWVPSVLSNVAILDRYNICASLLCRYTQENFLSRVVVADKRWIYLDEPKSNYWSNTDSVVSNYKALLFIWWDEEGVILTELIKPGWIDKYFYNRQLERLKAVLPQKRSQYRSTQSNIILHSEAIGNTYEVEVLKDYGWEVLPQPANSPDLAPSYYHLFKSMQLDLIKQYFKSINEVENWLHKYLNSKTSAFYSEGIRLLPEKWQKVVDSHGNYFN